MAAREQRALAHAQQDQRSGIGDCVVGDAAAVVPDLELEPAPMNPCGDGDARRASVARRVGQRLLDDAEHLRRPLGVEVQRLGARLEPAADAGAALEFFPRCRPTAGQSPAHLGPDSDKPAHEKLSDREYQILRFIAAGKSTRQIASDLSLSVKTVATYRARVLEKMKMKTAAELTSYAVRNHLAG